MGDLKNEPGIDEALRTERHLLHNSYLYGDELKDTYFQDAVINASIQQSTQYPRILKDRAAEVYTDTLGGDKWRSVFVSIIAWRLDLCDLENLLQSGAPEQFRNDLMEEVLRMVPRSKRIKYIVWERVSRMVPRLKKIEHIVWNDYPTREITGLVHRKRVSEPYPWQKDQCQYHLHGEGECMLDLLRWARST
ncbi:hypothetical protein B0J12DRAFT_702430 [Macrophomina phaseolina]|uniref:Uncharacterized protein n=1 Tax=Macrophomina phaseolina TaxID=35725 RepID=A0ABQ8G1W3_9PEZI|nr:hypothetical protein B0J12DRAFT_702430 [Macrophomina phaseolina]